MRFKYRIFSLILFGLLLLTFMKWPVEIFDYGNRWLYALAGTKSKSTKTFEVFVRPLPGGSTQDSCVLFLHGLGDQAHTWRHQILGALSDYPGIQALYAVNFPGSGRAQRMVEPSKYSVSKMALALEEEVLPSCEHWILVGNSLGGWIAHQLGAQAFQKIDGLVLVNPAGLKMDPGPILNIYSDLNLKNLLELRSKLSEENIFVPEFILNAVLRRFKKMPLVESLRAQAREEFIDETDHKVRIPVYLLWGRQDRLLPSDSPARLQKIYPRLGVHVLDDCGHKPQTQCPGLFTEILKEIFKESADKNLATRNTVEKDLAKVKSDLVGIEPL